jgi:hypothetical protein
VMSFLFQRPAIAESNPAMGKPTLVIWKEYLSSMQQVAVAICCS